LTYCTLLHHPFLSSFVVYVNTKPTEWVLWEHSGGAKNPSDWKANMRELCSFTTVEGFWQYFNHLPKPSDIFSDGVSKKLVGPENKTIEEYSLFKKGIEPGWEDPANAPGGEFFCRQTFDGETINLLWQNLVLGVVGETIEDGISGDDSLSGVINGCRVSDKSKGFPMFRLELWLNTRDPNIKDKTKTKLMEILMDGFPTQKKTIPKLDWRDHAQ